MIAKNPKVIMTAQQLIDRAKALAARKTFYRNKWPYNLCYIHKDGRTSADCVNLYKALLNGYDVTRQDAGYYQHDLSNTGDCTEAELLSQCTDVSQDFSIITAPEILYMKGHIGGYIGQTFIGGYEYNVIECTGSWGGGILYSWVDPDGTRRKFKGGSAARNKDGSICRWTHHGKMTKWVDYSNTTPAPVPEPKKKTNEEIAKEVIAGKWGNGADRKNRLTAAGYNYSDVQKIVNELCKKPSNSSSYEILYKVKPGDTLSGIAQRNNTTTAKLMELNKQIKNPNFIKAGDVIRIK